MTIDLAAIKQGQRTMWASGDYPEVARRIEGVAEHLVEVVGAGPGIELLDVATGSGNVAIAAALRGATVTGLDITPELLEAARHRASEAGAELSLLEGDAEELPFADHSFDVLTSCFGVIFAPRQARAASELLRVARPGGIAAVTGWTPEGVVGQTFAASGRFLPPPPAELTPPMMWGDEQHVRSLFGDGAELSFERRSVTFTADSPEAWLERDERILGPAILAKAALEAQGRYGELREQLLTLYRERNEASDGSLRVEADYLVTVARLPA